MPQRLNFLTLLLKKGMPGPARFLALAVDDPLKTSQFELVDSRVSQKMFSLPHPQPTTLILAHTKSTKPTA